MVHIILGLFFIALGVWGVFDEWYYVVDCVKGGSAFLLTVAGACGMFAGVAGRRAGLKAVASRTPLRGRTYAEENEHGDG